LWSTVSDCGAEKLAVADIQGDRGRWGRATERYMMRNVTSRSRARAAAAAALTLLQGAASLTGGANASINGTGYDHWADGGCKARAYPPVRVARAALEVRGVQYCPVGLNHTLQVCVAVQNGLPACKPLDKSSSPQPQIQRLAVRCVSGVAYKSFIRGVWWPQLRGWGVDSRLMPQDTDYSRPLRC
jgi:hypothetical protein